MTELLGTPVGAVTLTVAAYLAAVRLQQRAGGSALLNPVLLAIAAVAGVLALADVDYADYFRGAQPVHLLLGPATVALAVPLHRQAAALRREAAPVLVAVVVGSLTAALTAVVVAEALGASRATVLSLAPKSATTPVSIAVAEEIGGLPPLTAALTILTGILGAVAGPWLLRRVGLRDERATGLALGTASHGIGTARAVQLGGRVTAYAGLGLALGAIVTAVLVPVIVRVL